MGPFVVGAGATSVNAGEGVVGMAGSSGTDAGVATHAASVIVTVPTSSAPRRAEPCRRGRVISLSCTPERYCVWL